MVKSGTKMMYGMPAKEKVPERFLERLTEEFKMFDSVESAFFTQVYVPSSGEPPHLLIALKINRPFDTYLNNAIGRAAKDTLKSDQFVDIVPMNNTLSGWQISDGVRVFYRKTSTPYG